MILGSDVFARIIHTIAEVPNSRSPNEPVAIETLLGYLVVGNAPTVEVGIQPDNASNFFCSFENCISRFFEVEELPKQEYLTPAEKDCENIFQKTTTTRDE